MNEDIRGEMYGEIMKCFKKLETLEPTSEEYTKVLKNLKELTDIALADLRDDTEYIDKQARREMEKEQKEKEYSSNRVHRGLQLGVEALKVVAPISALFAATKEYMVYEENHIAPQFLKAMMMSFIPKFKL